MHDKTIASDLPPPPQNPAGPAPLRRANSVRRTCSLDMQWPEGHSTDTTFDGRCRDIVTGDPSQPPTVIAEDQLWARLNPNRIIEEIRAHPSRPEVQQLVGEQGGGYLRKALDEKLPAEKDIASPLYLLIDDLSGASLVAGWAWSRWMHDWLPEGYVPEDEEQARIERHERMHSICVGFRPGSAALDDLRGHRQNSYPVPELRNPHDPAGWHTMPDFPGTTMRRARRVDAWFEGGIIHIDAGFQDSASTPAGHREAVHEYRVSATADPQTMTLLSIEADPRILPYRECPAAVDNVQRLVGEPLAELRSTVLSVLRRINGCTHLNDVLRSLAEVPALVKYLEEPKAQSRNV